MKKILGPMIQIQTSNLMGPSEILRTEHTTQYPVWLRQSSGSYCSVCISECHKSDQESDLESIVLTCTHMVHEDQIFVLLVIHREQHGAHLASFDDNSSFCNEIGKKSHILQKATSE